MKFGGRITMLLGLFSLLLIGGCVTKPTHGPLNVSRSFESKYEAICGEIQSQPDFEKCNPKLFEAAKLLNSHPSQFRATAQQTGLPLLLPKFDLPILAFHLVVEKPATQGLGVPMVLEYDTSATPFYPPEGLFIRTTLIAEKRANGVQFRLTGTVDTLQIDGNEVALATDPSSPAVLLTERASILSKSGFASMIRPELMKRKPRIYLLQPYDPNKIPFLMAHGLQSTPVAFSQLIQTLLKDPDFRKN